MKGERPIMATTNQNYQYFTKAIPLPSGKRKYVRAKTQEELDAKVKELTDLMSVGVNISGDMTLGEFAQQWFDVYKKPYLREKSQDIVKYVVNGYILPALGGYVLREITPMQIQALMASLTGKSYSLQSKVLINLRDIFKAAEENDLVTKSPVSNRLKAGGRTTQEKEILTPDEAQRLLNAVTNPRAHTFLLLCLHTGARRGEALALRYSDVDFENKVVHIRHNAIVKQGETTISDEMKTKAGRRDVPLSEELETCLLEQRKTAKSDYIFTMQNGKPLTKNAFRKLFEHISRELPEKHITAHSLRHTYITRLFEAGLDIKEIQYLAGHATVDMTLSVYTHYDRLSREAETAKKVRNALAAPEKRQKSTSKKSSEKCVENSGKVIMLPRLSAG